MIHALAVQAAQMLLVLALAPLLVGFVRKVKARLVRRQGPPLVQPYRDLIRLLRKDVVLADNASWLFRAIPYLDLRRDLGRRGAGADLRHRLDLFLVGRSHRHHRVAWIWRASCSRWPAWMSARASAASARAAR